MDVSLSPNGLSLRIRAVLLTGTELLLEGLLCFGRERKWQHKQQRTKEATTKMRTPRKITIIDTEDIIVGCYIVNLTNEP